MEIPRIIHVIEAAAEPGRDLQQVTGTAYSGGAYRQWWSQAPCYTDLAGMEIAAQIPLMYNHINDPEFRLGAVAVEIQNEQLVITGGGIDSESEHGKDVIDAGRKCDWQLSHGAEIKEIKNLDEGETATVNGREIAGPACIVAKSILREISVVAVGADSDTSLRIAAGFNHNHSTGGKAMNPTPSEVGAAILAEPTTVNAAVNAAVPVEDVSAIAAKAVSDERARVAEVRAALKDIPSMIDKAIDAGWSADYCRTVAEGVKAAQAGMLSCANIIVKPQSQTTADVLTAALELRAGISESTVLASHGEQTMEQADKMRGISLHEALVEACHLANLNTGVTLDHSTIQAALSTTDLPGIMSNVAHKAMLQEFKAYQILATKLCSAGDLADYKEALRIRMTDVGELEIVPAGGEVPDTQMAEETATNKAERYAKSFWLDEMLIINDDLGQFLRIPRLFAARGARLIDKVFFQRLLENPGQKDGYTLFSYKHNNFIGGADSALTLAALKAARAKFLQQVDANGDPIAVNPKYLLVPSDLEATAQELVQSALIVAGGDTARPATNIIAKWGLEVVASPYLQMSKYKNSSVTGWYLFANPAEVDTFEIGYLRGQRVPTVERGQFDLQHFGVGYRVRFDFGIRELDHRGVQFNKGVAGD